MRRLLLLLLILMVPTELYAVTTFTAVVDTDGTPPTGGYSSLSSAQAALNADLTSALVRVYTHGGVTGTISDGALVTGQTNGYAATAINVTDTQIFVIHDTVSETFAANEQVQVDGSNHVTIDSGDGGGDTVAVTVETTVGSGTAADTTGVSFSGWTTSATNDLTIRQATSDRHAGVYSDSLYRLVPAGTELIELEVNYLTVDGLQTSFSHTGTAIDWQLDFQEDAITGAADVTLKNNIIRRTANANLDDVHFGIWVELNGTSQTFRIYNNLIYGMVNDFAGRDGYGMSVNQGAVSFGSLYIDNNTFYDCDIGLGIWQSEGYTGNLYIRNNIGRSCSTTACFSDAWSGDAYTADYNSADDATATGINSTQTSGSPWNSSADNDSDYWTSATNDDFTLISGSYAADVGSDLSGLFTTDAVGTTRSDWDLGFFEYASGAVNLFKGVLNGVFNAN